MIQWEVFFLYYHDTDDVDHDYGDYYDDVHEPMMYSFRWIVIVMVIMLQNYKKRWLNILWRSFLSVLAKPTKKKKTYAILMRTEFYESFPLTIRGDISQYIQIAPSILVQSRFSDIQWLNTMTRDLFHSWSIWIDPCKCHEIFQFPLGNSWRRNLIQTDGSEKKGNKSETKRPFIG